jgi:hypothetical protein
MSNIMDFHKPLTDLETEKARERFMTSLRHFRDIMCSSEHSIEDKDAAFEDLATDLFRTEGLTENDRILFEATMREWSIRREYEFFNRREKERL